MKTEALSGEGRKAKMDPGGAAGGLAMAPTKADTMRPYGDGEIQGDNVTPTARAGYTRASHKGTTGSVEGGHEIDGGA